MRNVRINQACTLVVVIVGALWAGATGGAAVYDERDEITKTFTLAPKARVDVSAISGSVDIKAIDGYTATVQIERTARSRAEMDCNRVVLEQSSSGLKIQGETVDCRNAQVDYRVLLSLPRDVDLSVHGVSGPINIGEIDGALRVSGNSGRIDLVQAGSRSRITGNSGPISIKLLKLDTGGLALTGNSGPIKLYIGDELNVNVKASGLSGSASSELPNVEFKKTGPADYYARIGSGGPTINLDGNSGSISLLPNRD
jgi:hypothetical protein